MRWHFTQSGPGVRGSLYSAAAVALALQQPQALFRHQTPFSDNVHSCYNSDGLRTIAAVPSHQRPPLIACDIGPFSTEYKQTALGKSCTD